MKSNISKRDQRILDMIHARLEEIGETGKVRITLQSLINERQPVGTPGPVQRESLQIQGLIEAAYILGIITQVEVKSLEQKALEAIWWERDLIWKASKALGGT